MGIDKTVMRIKERCWFPNIHKVTKEFIARCGLCQRNKNRKSLQSEMHPLSVEKPFARVHIDLVGPLKKTERVNTRILVMKDAATKFVVLAPIINKEASVVAESVMNKLICRFGIPNELFHDQGKEFINKLFKDLTSRLGIQQKMTSVYNPSSNGQVERVNSTVMSVLRTLVNPDHGTWDLVLPQVEFSLNTSIPKGYKWSAFYLMHGRNANTPLDIIINSKSENLDQHTWWKALCNARVAAAALEGRFKEKFKNRHDSKIKKDEVNVGDLVLVKVTTTKKGKLGSLQENNKDHLRLSTFKEVQQQL